MEAAGKVSAIEHVIKGVNPQGVLVAQVLVETVRSLESE